MRGVGHRSAAAHIAEPESSTALGQLYGLCKGPHSLSFAAFLSDGIACFTIDFRQVQTCGTTWRKL